MARLEFRLPDIGEGVAEAELVEWTAQVGDDLKEGQAVASVMTDKATVELEAPADGVLLERRGEPGEMLAVGQVLFVLDTRLAEGSPSDVTAATSSTVEPEQRPMPDSSPRESAHTPGDRALAPPAVRQRARNLGVDLSRVPAGGKHITHEDLDRYLLANAPRASSPKLETGVQGTDLPLTGLRRQIARRMQEALLIPHFTYVEEVDVTLLEQLRANRNSEPAGKRLSLLPFVVVGLCHALRKFPGLNAHYDGGREVLTRFDPIHLGIATHSEDGLMVPTLRDAQDKTVRQVAEEIADLAFSARAGKLARDRMRGSTFTVTSLGKLGGIAATPIINPPEVAILAVHRVTDRAVVLDDRIQPRKMVNLSISCDHRVIDGQVAAAFVEELKRSLENPDWCG